MAPDPKLDPLRDERIRKRRRISRLERLVANITARIEAVRKRRDQLDVRGFCLDGCSMPLVWKLVLLDCRGNGWDGRPSSADRTVEHCDDCSDKSSQLELWQCAQAGNCAPANPPRTGSHEYLNGATSQFGTGSPAYATKFPRGAKLPAWGLGIDLTEPEEFMAVAKRLGYEVHRPFSGEAWHVQLSENPIPNLIKRGRV